MFGFQAFLSYFDVSFDDGVANPVYMSTSPQMTETHWKQTVFYLAEPFKVHEGEFIVLFH